MIPYISRNRLDLRGQRPLVLMLFEFEFDLAKIVLAPSILALFNNNKKTVTLPDHFKMARKNL